MKALEEASYIWSTPFEEGKDLYRIFRGTFDWNRRKSPRVTLEIAADSTFKACVNGHRCPISQTADFPECRTSSSLDITNWLVPGKNVIAVEVHYLGEPFLTYQPGVPFLRAAIHDGNTLLVKTDASWKCAESMAYRSALACKVTSQLGFVFSYDARNAQMWEDPAFDDSAWHSAAVYTDTANWKEMTERKVIV